MSSEASSSNGEGQDEGDEGSHRDGSSGESTGPKLDQADGGTGDTGRSEDYPEEMVACTEPIEPVSLLFEGSLLPERCGQEVQFEGRGISSSGHELVIDGCPCDLDCAEEDPQRFVIEHPMFETVLEEKLYGADCWRVVASASDCEEVGLHVESVNSAVPFAWTYARTRIELPDANPLVYTDEWIEARLGAADASCVDPEGVPVESFLIEGELEFVGQSPFEFELSEGQFEHIGYWDHFGKLGELPDFWGHVHQARTLEGGSVHVEFMSSQRPGVSL